MGRDYEAAVMSGGFIGFMLGTTANAMAVMSTLTERHGPAPRAFLVAPMVGAFFIDFTNAIIITATLNLLQVKRRAADQRAVIQSSPHTGHHLLVRQFTAQPR